MAMVERILCPNTCAEIQIISSSMQGVPQDQGDREKIFCSCDAKKQLHSNRIVDHHVHDINKTIGKTPSMPIDVASVMGRDQEKHQIIFKLVENKDNQGIKTVSIFGFGGYGNTTLASLVFNDVNDIEHFEARLVHVSQEFDVEKLINKLSEIIADKDPGQHSVPYMTKRIKAELTGKRFLLVLDDQSPEFSGKLHGVTQVWHTWQQDFTHCSQQKRVTETVGSRDQFALQFLSIDNSWKLFPTKPGNSCRRFGVRICSGWKRYCEEMVGVPLTIKGLAGVLRCKERIESKNGSP